MNKAKKRGNLWRVQVYDYTDEQGRRHNKSFSAPTKKEAEYLAAEFIRFKTQHGASRLMTVGKAIDEYIKLKPMLSPTTLTAYEKMRRLGFQEIMDIPVSDLNDVKMQIAINNEAMRMSDRTGKPIGAKTLKNEYGLLAAALKVVCKRSFIVSLPQSQKHIKEYPEIQDVIRVLKGTDVELPCMLSLWLTFSMSEIRGLRCSDIKNGCITINRVVVDTKDGSVTKDNAKVETRLRKHVLPQYIMELIEKTPEYQNYLKTGQDGFLITMDRCKIYRHWKSIAKSIGYDLTFHDLRHLSASAMLFLGIPTKYAMERGGWKTDSVMKSVYQHTLSDERLFFDKKVNDYFEMYTQNDNQET